MYYYYTTFIIFFKVCRCNEMKNKSYKISESFHPKNILSLQIYLIKESQNRRAPIKYIHSLKIKKR